jgi:hypothetical protein
MRCETCQGQRFIRTADHDPLMPCPSCGGFGEMSCCGDVCDQPEPDENDAVPL